MSVFGHLQTMWWPLWPAPHVATTHETWETADGDVLDLEFLPARPGRPGIVALHGLEGSSRASYIRRMLRSADALGWNGAGLNFRSCGPSTQKFPRSYHSGETGDLRFVVERLAARWGGAPLGVIGFSLGGNVVLKFLGEESDRGCATVAAAVAVSTPYDLSAAAAALDAPGLFPALYRRRFLRSLRRKTNRALARFPRAVDAAKVAAARSFSDFDDAVTAPLHGFRDARDYWAQSSSANFVAHIRVPTLLLSAEDDPIAPWSSIPRAAIAANPALTLDATPRGGHVGFVEGFPFRPRFGAERRAFAFLRGLLEHAR